MPPRGAPPKPALYVGWCFLLAADAVNRQNIAIFRCCCECSGPDVLGNFCGMTHFRIEALKALDRQSL